MRDAPNDYRGTAVRQLPKASRTFAPGRVCAHEDCSTKLSIYNRSELCWQHEPIRPYVERGQRKRREAA